MPVPDVHSDWFLKTRVVEQPMEDILDTFLDLRLSNLQARAGSIMQTSLPSSTQFEFCSFPSFNTVLTQMLQHASACSPMVIKGKERKQYVGHSASLLPGMI